ncbi:MAG: hypothetical protein AAGD33_01200 [Actinomycetota bacterium]
MIDRRSASRPAWRLTPPGGTTHAYTVAADGTRFLTILGTGNAHDFYRQMSAEVSLPPDLDDLMRITAAHGITIGG